MNKFDVGFFDVNSNCPDLVIENGDLKPDNTLETAALISTFTDRRVTLEELPEGLTDRRGWWADLISDPVDDLIGSRLWTLEREGKVTDETAVEAESILDEAFSWMLRDGLAQSVVVNAEITGQFEIRATVTITKPDGENIPLKFLWDGQALRLVGG